VSVLSALEFFTLLIFTFVVVVAERHWRVQVSGGARDVAVQVELDSKGLKTGDHFIGRLKGQAQGL
jgi:hypothetical protein